MRGGIPEGKQMLPSHRRTPVSERKRPAGDEPAETVRALLRSASVGRTGSARVSARLEGGRRLRADALETRSPVEPVQKS